MGIASDAVQFLYKAESAGVRFDRTLTLGRQFLFIEPGIFLDLAKKNRPGTNETEIRRLMNEQKGFAEPFIETLGAHEIQSMDAAAFEGASIIHDLNDPVPEALKNRFTVVLDGGCLEHVFDFKTAIRNCMEMVAVGGHFVSIAPTNNWMGHGFYQFSPELFYRVFSRNNGFAVEFMALCEGPPQEFPYAPWYRVVDPELVRQRVILVNSRPVHLFMIAKRIETVPIFKTNPQQSDYEAAWKQGPLSESTREEKGSAFARSSASSLKPILRNIYRKSRFILSTLKSRSFPHDVNEPLDQNPEFFQKIIL